MNNQEINKKTALVFGLTSNHIFAVGSVIMDLKKYSPSIADEVVIFYDKPLKESDKRILMEFFPIRFIRYNFPIKDTSIFNQGTLNYFSKMVFSKYECLALLKEYKTVLWLDYDIIVTKDISEIMSYSESGIKMMISPGCPVRKQLHEPISDYDMDLEAICASTFVFQDHLSNYMQLYDFCYSKLQKYAKYLYFGEQAIFDFMIQEFKLKLDVLDSKIWTPHPTDYHAHNDAKILHAFGQPKFWNGLENEQWNKNYREWVAKGGSKKELGFFQILNKKLFYFIRHYLLMK